MRPRIEVLSPGACRLNTALGIVELFAAGVLLILVFEGLFADRPSAPAMAGGLLFAIALIAAGIVHLVFASKARRGDADPSLTMWALGLGFLNIPWGTAVALYTWMRLGDPTQEALTR